MGQALEKLAEVDVLVHPSLHDSGGYVVAEAMAAGRPVICLDLGGPALQVAEETGFKIPATTPEQVVAGMAQAMLWLARDDALRRRMGGGASAGERAVLLGEEKRRNRSALQGLGGIMILRFAHVAKGRRLIFLGGKPKLAKPAWQFALWFILFGLTVWSYGFNNIPLIRPLPLVDALVGYVVLWSAPAWWRLVQTSSLVRRLFGLLFAFSVVVAVRVMADWSHYGMSAARDALFAVELWVLLPAIALGRRITFVQISRRLNLLFGVALLWFLLYPYRATIEVISPIVGIQRPVPLFAFTTAGFVAVPAFSWFFWFKRSWGGAVMAVASLLVLLFVQSRGAYLAFFASVFILACAASSESLPMGQTCPGRDRGFRCSGRSWPSPGPAGRADRLACSHRSTGNLVGEIRPRRRKFSPSVAGLAGSHPTGYRRAFGPFGGNWTGPRPFWWI